MDNKINASALKAYENLKKARKKYESKCSTIKVRKETLAKLNDLKENMSINDFINYLLNLHEFKMSKNN
jgi:lipoate-protein ligase A